MNCGKVLSMLPEMVSGELDPRTHAEISAHIESCAGCHEQMLSYQAAFKALDHAWTPVPAPAVLVIPERVGRHNDARRLKLVLAGVCCLAIAAIAVAVVTPRTHPAGRTQAMMPRQDNPRTQEKPVIQPASEAKSVPKSEPDEKQRTPETNTPPWRIERRRPPKIWDYCAKKPHNPVTDRIRHTRPRHEESPTVTVKCVPPVPPVAVTRSCTVPTTAKTTRQVVIYDGDGNRRTLQVEAEEQIAQPCTMASY